MGLPVQAVSNGRSKALRHRPSLRSMMDGSKAGSEAGLGEGLTPLAPWQRFAGFRYCGQALRLADRAVRHPRLL